MNTEKYTSGNCTSGHGPSTGHLPQLPLEVWDQILCQHVDFTRSELGALCIVGNTFKEVCQALLFRNLSVSPKALRHYHDLEDRVTSPPAVQLYTSSQRRERLEVIRRSYISPSTGMPDCSSPWMKWEEDLLCIMESTYRLSSIGDHEQLRCLPRLLKIEVYDTSVGSQGSWDRFDPFQPPFHQAARFVYDALVHLRTALAQSLRRLEGIRGIELGGCPIDRNLLEAIASLDQLSEIKLTRCWFLSPPTPLTSVTSMSFCHIPAEHLAHAYRLISPAHITSLELVSWGGAAALLAFKEFCARAVSEKIEFSELRDLTLRARLDTSKPIAYLRNLLTRTPVLRTLTIRGQYDNSDRELGGLCPTSHIPALQVLSCSLQIARVIVPGRPVEDLTMELGMPTGGHEFIAADEHELKSLLHPLALSTATITTLVLLSGCALAPVWQLIPCIRAMFPGLKELRCTMSGARDQLTQGTASDHGGGPSGPSTALSHFEALFPCANGKHPHNKPVCLEDVLFFLARGHYQLPQTIVKLVIMPHFYGKQLHFRHQGELFMQAVLEGIIEWHPEMSELEIESAFALRRFPSYHRVVRDGNWMWQKRG